MNEKGGKRSKGAGLEGKKLLDTVGTGRQADRQAGERESPKGKDELDVAHKQAKNGEKFKKWGKMPEEIDKVR